MADTLTCYQCQRVIRPSKPLPAGTRVKCPGCATVLTIPGVMGQDMVGFRTAAPAAPPPPPAPSLPIPDDEPAPRRRPRYEEEDRPSCREPRRRDDYEDDYDRPRRRRSEDDRRPSIRKSSSGGKGLVIGLSIGGGVLGLLVVGLILFFALRGGSRADGLVGTWESNQFGMRVRIEFNADGTMVQDLGLMRINQTYRIVNANTIEVKTDPLAALNIKFPGGMGPRPGGFPGGQITERMSFQVNGNTLIINDRGMTKRFRRL